MGESGARTSFVDNPDQRIAEDIRSFTEFSLSFFLTLATSVIDLIAFSYILFSIMLKLFLTIFAFASIGALLTVCIGKRLIRLNYDALQKEADFRFSLVRVRENAESIAFYAGEGVEERVSRAREWGDAMQVLQSAHRCLRHGVLLPAGVLSLEAGGWLCSHPAR